MLEEGATGHEGGFAGGDAPALLHPGLGCGIWAARQLDIQGDNEVPRLPLVLAACAFPGPGVEEPWALLLVMCHAGRDGELFDAAVGAAWQQLGEQLVDAVLSDGVEAIEGFTEAFTSAADRARAAQTQGVTTRLVHDDGRRQIVELD